MVGRLRELWRYSLAGTALRKLLRWAMPRNAALPILRGRLRGKKWVVRSSFESCWFGVYEYEKQVAFIEHIAPGNVVFDIGANVGFYTLLASELVGPGGKVYSFEPLPRNLSFLKRHLELNGIQNVVVCEGAVSDRAGTAKFDTSCTPEMTHLSDTGQLEVKTFRLDDLLASGQVLPPQVMKIDVEGAEMDVLEGARALLAQSRPKLFLATHGDEVHRRCCAFLRDMGYKLAPLDDRPLEESSEVYATAQAQ